MMAAHRSDHPRTRILAAALVLLVATAGAAHAQQASLSGFITDASDGLPLEGATIVLRDPASSDDMPLYGTAANADGLYLIRSIEPGTYAMTISFVGFEPVLDTLTLAEGDGANRNAALTPTEEALDEVLVRAERQSGMARVTAGHQRIMPEEIELVPSPDISADLANYLTTLPGIVTTGDRGGHFYVRGGEPSQNLVLLDGMVIYQPFHMLSFYSAFPSDVLNRVDFYAGGFPARYSGRLSSVIDVASRYGNSRRFAGMASASPFTSALRVEGPIVPGHASFIFSARESMLERGAERLVDRDLPFKFGDLFAKVYGPVSRYSRLSISALRTHDRGTIGEDVGGEAPDEIRWRNEALGARWMLVPNVIPVILNVYASRSSHHTELGPEDAPIRLSTVSHTRVAAEAYFEEGRITMEGGWDALLADAKHHLDGIFQLPEQSGKPFTEFGFYLQPSYDLGDGLRLMPSARLQWYQIKIDPFIEPRLRATWDRGIHHLSGAIGMYNQEVVGINDRRDVANAFTVWSVVPRPNDREDNPRAGRLGKSIHGMIGYRGTPLPWLEASVEGFYKHMENLYVAEWTAFPWLTTRLHPASGRSFGFEARLEIRREPFYGFLNYGLSSTLYDTKYEAIQYWFGQESLSFRPPHDRRHQVSALGSTSWKGFDVSVRWTFGSGLPYTRPLGFDSFVLLDRAGSVFDMDRSRRVIYDRPFNAVLPTYHRLDLSLERTFSLAAADLTLQGSVINTYDRRNLFYLDMFTMRRVDQLPLVPSFGVRVSFE